MVVAFSPGIEFDTTQRPNDVFGPDRFVPYERARQVNSTCDEFSSCNCIALVITLHLDMYPILVVSGHLPRQVGVRGS